MKIITKPQNIKPIDFEKQNKKEYDLLKMCQDDNIVKVLGTNFHIKQYIEGAIIFEYLPEGDLQQFMDVSSFEDININFCVQVMKQITKGLLRLNEFNIIHGDLAARNILVKEKDNNEYTFKIADFGLSRLGYVTESPTTTTTTTTTTTNINKEFYRKKEKEKIPSQDYPPEFFVLMNIVIN